MAVANFSWIRWGFALCLLPLTACSVAHPPLERLSATLASLPDIDDQSGISSDPSRGARPALTVAKHQLRDWLEAELAYNSNAHAPYVNANGFATLVNSKLKAAGIRTLPVQVWVNEGVVIAATSFEIECGIDTSIYGWNWDGKAWRRVIEHEITDYAPDSYHPEAVFGPENVRFAPVDPSGGGKIHVLVTAVNTWCTSGWLGRRFQLYDVDRQAESAMLLVDGELPAFVLDGDQNASLTSDRMVIEYTGNDMDPRKIPFGIRASVYALADGKATPVRWAAADAEDFTEKWMTAAWAESSMVSAPGNRALKQWHRRLHGLSPRPDAAEWTSFADAVRCGDYSGTWEYAIVFGTPRPATELVAAGTSTICRHMAGDPTGTCTEVPAPGQLERAKLDFIRPSTAYFVMKEIASNQFSMMEIRSTPAPSCPKMGV